MSIDYEKIKEIYGEEVLINLNNEDELQNFKRNIEYIKTKNIEEPNEIVESYFLIFLYDHSEFKKKLDNLIKKLGNDYINIIAENQEVLEELL